MFAAAALASPASAGLVNLPERPTVNSSRLTPAERRAITVKSISMVVDGSLGLTVTVAFQGDVERYLGQGDVANGLVALVLVPATSGGTSAGLVDEGGGFTPTRVPILKEAGKRPVVTTRMVDLFSPEKVLHVHTPPAAGVVRHGSEIVFYLDRSVLSWLGEVRLKVFARSPTAGGLRAGARSWPAIVDARPAEVATLAVDRSELSYVQLAVPRDALTGLVSAAIDPELRAQEQVATTLAATVAGYGAVAKAMGQTHRLRRVSKETIAFDLIQASRRTSRLKGEAAAMNSLVARIDGLIGARTPPQSRPPPQAPPSQAPPPQPPPPQPSPPSPNVQVVQTDPTLSQNMAAETGVTTSSTAPQGVTDMIDVNDQLRYQQFRGLGAAMTDSSAYVINGMPAADRAALVQDLFGQPSSASGLAAPPIHLNFLRIGIGATGAMTVSPAYSYDDNPRGGSDPNLDGFSIAHDTTYIIPTLQQALEANPSLEILANPWSPPAWMKSSDSLGNSNASGSLLDQDYGTYANYFVKLIRDYAQDGIPIDAITPANEPTSGTGGTAYPGLNFPEPDEARFIADNLEPALSQAGLHPRIYGNDLSWDQYTDYAGPLASRPDAGPDLAGIAWHCYFGSPTAMSQLQQTTPGLDQIVDECSPEIRSFGTPEFLISTLRNWASVVAVWSVALEPNGQPIQTPNDCGGCRGLVSVDPSSGDVTYRTEYYQFGQVSAFVQPGAWRIDSPNFVTYGTSNSNWESISSGLDDVAFLNPDGSKVLVAYNNSSAPISFGVETGSSYFSYTIPVAAMTTFLWH